jgi:hypothetical protein
VRLIPAPDQRGGIVAGNGMAMATKPKEIPDFEQAHNGTSAAATTVERGRVAVQLNRSMSYVCSKIGF